MNEKKEEKLIISHFLNTYNIPQLYSTLNSSVNSMHNFFCSMQSEDVFLDDERRLIWNKFSFLRRFFINNALKVSENSNGIVSTKNWNFKVVLCLVSFYFRPKVERVKRLIKSPSHESALIKFWTQKRN